MITKALITSRLREVGITPIAIHRNGRSFEVYMPLTDEIDEMLCNKALDTKQLHVCDYRYTPFNGSEVIIRQSTGLTWNQTVKVEFHSSERN